MNIVAYILNGALYISHLAQQKFPYSSTVILKNVKGIVRTGKKRNRAIKQNFLESCMQVMKMWSSSKCVHGYSGRKLAPVWWPLVHLEQCKSILLSSPRGAYLLLLACNAQVPLLDVCVMALSTFPLLRCLPARATPVPWGSEDRLPHVRGVVGQTLDGSALSRQPHIQGY